MDGEIPLFAPLKRYGQRMTWMADAVDDGTDVERTHWDDDMIDDGMEQRRWR